MGTDTITTSEHAAMSGFLLPLEEFRLRVEEALADFFDEKLAEVEDEPEGRELVREVRRLVEGGGKRLRPALVYHTYRALGGRSDEAVLPLALATELLHTYLLIHDDIMDHSELRRGQPSAHARFREIHVDRGRAGDAADLGAPSPFCWGIWRTPGPWSCTPRPAPRWPTARGAAAPWMARSAGCARR